MSVLPREPLQKVGQTRGTSTKNGVLGAIEHRDFDIKWRLRRPECPAGPVLVFLKLPYNLTQKYQRFPMFLSRFSKEKTKTQHNLKLNRRIRYFTEPP